MNGILHRILLRILSIFFDGRPDLYGKRDMFFELYLQSGQQKLQMNENVENQFFIRGLITFPLIHPSNFPFIFDTSFEDLIEFYLILKFRFKISIYSRRIFSTKLL